jgi:hypothetical protein
MSISRLFGLQVVRPHLPRNSAHPCANPGADLGSGQMFRKGNQESRTGFGMSIHLVMMLMMMKHLIIS